jgi:DNA adenine methylase
MLSPLVKSLGGKRRLAQRILLEAPARITQFVEPFVGGGAIFASLHNSGRLVGVPVTLNDANENLIDLYTQVRDDPKTLLREVGVLAREYADAPACLYTRIRGEWNDGFRSPARFLFLKQTAFNGLWRLSRAGKMNASWGKYAAPRLCDVENVQAWHAALSKVTLTSADGASVAARAEEGALVYLDPPYLGTFDGYTAGGFDVAQHAELLTVAWRCTQRGVSVLYSNSLEASSLASLAWPSGKQLKITTSYTVNRDGSARAPLEELFIVQNAGDTVPEQTRRARTAVRRTA